MPDGASIAGVERTPPHAIPAEQALLAALLVNNRSLERVAEFLRPEHFFDPTNARLYAACESLIVAGRRADVVTLRPYLAEDADAAEMGGQDYVRHLVADALVTTDVEDYGRAILDAWRKRSLIETAEALLAEAWAGPAAGTAEQLVDRHGARIFETINGETGLHGLKPFRSGVATALETADKAHKAGGRVTGLATGYADLDAKLGGLHAPDLIILAGRPSMGKSALAAWIAFNAARAGTPVGFWSLEMSEEQLANRLIAGWAAVSSHAVLQGHLKGWQMQQLVEAGSQLSALPLHIDDSPALMIDQFRLKARAAKRQHSLGLIVVDYLQLMRGPSFGKNRGQENRTQEVSEITRGLKAVAKELEVPVLALSQLSRQVEQREDKRPQLSDLRESGSIEQDADVVGFIYREGYYLERAEPSRGASDNAERYADKLTRWHEARDACAGIAEVIIAKQRHGPTGTVKLHFNEELVRFENHAGRSE